MPKNMTSLNVIIHFIFWQVSPLSEPTYLLRKISHGILILSQVYMPCYFGNELQLVSQKIAYSLLHSRWVVADIRPRKASNLPGNSKKAQKSFQDLALELKARSIEKYYQTALIIFIENSKSPIILNPYGLVPIDLMTFQNVGNFAYSLFTFFINYKKV